MTAPTTFQCKHCGWTTQGTAAVPAKFAHDCLHQPEHPQSWIVLGHDTTLNRTTPGTAKARTSAIQDVIDRYMAAAGESAIDDTEVNQYRAEAIAALRALGVQDHELPTRWTNRTDHHVRQQIRLAAEQASKATGIPAIDILTTLQQLIRNPQEQPDGQE